MKAIGRAGAGTNNIPVKAMSARGVPVFNAPGANANAVKELVLAGMLMAARNLAAGAALRRRARPGDRADLDKAVEDGKKSFAGFELAGQTLGIIGLGKIGCLVADAAIKLGMNVLGLRPRHHRRRGLEPAVAGEEGRAASTEVLQERATSSRLHVPLVDGDAPPGQRRQHRR